MLVLAQVSSMKTRRVGSIRPWYFFHCARRRATSGRSCSLACRLFFETDPFVLGEVPDREVAHPDATLGQLRGDRTQRQVRCLGNPPQQPVSLAGKRKRTPAAYLQRRRAPSRSEPLRPLHDARHTHAESRSHSPARLTSRNRPNNPLTKIQGISASHPCWPPA